MRSTGEAYLTELAGFPAKTFPCHFSNSATRLQLGAVLDRTELQWLYHAAFAAALCNIAINGLGGCGGRILPEREPNRIRLEAEFMTARDKFYACAGRQVLPPPVSRSIQRIFLSVFVNEDNLAPYCQ
jgi:hypothetical protein